MAFSFYFSSLFHFLVGVDVMFGGVVVVVAFVLLVVPSFLSFVVRCFRCSSPCLTYKFIATNYVWHLAYA